MINDFDSIEFDLIFKKILNDNISSNIKTVKEPKAYILGGQPGAGKSRLNNHLQKINSGNIVIINGDEYRKFVLI